MTEYTERKSDLIDKASLKAAGIEITSDQVTLYGKKIKVKKNQYLPAKTYEFVRLSSSERLQTWMKNNGTLLALEGVLFIMALIFMIIARIS